MASTETMTRRLRPCFGAGVLRRGRGRGAGAAGAAALLLELEAGVGELDEIADRLGFQIADQQFQYLGQLVS